VFANSLWRNVYSVVIPTRPVEPYLAEALDSIASQDSETSEVIIVINGPNSIGCDLSEVARRHPLRPHVIETPIAGTSAALAKGISLASTPLVAFLDADDLWPEGRMRRHLDLLSTAPTADAVSALTSNFRDDPSGRRRCEAPKPGRLFQATTFRRSTFTRLGPPDPSAGHFTWLYRWWSQAQNRGITIQSDQNVGLLRRLHDGNGWVTGKESGRLELLVELRNITQSRQDVQ